jgi:hypothetical protein
MTKRAAPLTLLFLVSSLVARTVPAVAQMVTGVVEDSSGFPISEAFVALEDTANRIATRTLTGAGGVYYLSAPQPGRPKTNTS